MRSRASCRIAHRVSTAAISARSAAATRCRSSKRRSFGSGASGILRDLVKTRYGFHIVAVDQRIPGKTLPFETGARTDRRAAQSERRRAGVAAICFSTGGPIGNHRSGLERSEYAPSAMTWLQERRSVMNSDYPSPTDIAHKRRELAPAQQAAFDAFGKVALAHVTQCP